MPGRAVPALARTTPREAAWRGFLFTGGLFLAGTYWIYHSIHLVGGARSGHAVPDPGMVAIMSRTRRRSAMSLHAGCRSSGWLRWLVALPLLWVLCEWLRGWLLSGFPWLALGYSQLDAAARVCAA